MKNLLSKFDGSYVYAFLGEATLGLTFIFYIALARVLGPEDYGVFTAAIALAAILSFFIQFGLPKLINREVAARPAESLRSLALVLTIEGLTSLAVLVALFPLTWLLGYREDTMLICYLAVLAEVGRSMILTLRGAMKGLGWFRAESIIVTIERIAFVALALIILFRTQNLAAVIATVVVVRAVHIMGVLIFLRQHAAISAPFNWRKMRSTLRLAYPFAISSVLWILYYQVDVVMLKSLSTETETGLYSASYRILEMFSALPRVMFYVIFTRLAQYQVSAPEKLPIQLYRGVRLLVLLVIPMVLAAGVLQRYLVNFIYGPEFAQAVRSLSILLPSLAVKVFGSLVEQFLQATGQEHRVPKILTFTATANVAINAFLIPQFAAVGAAIATLLSECILLGFSVRILSLVGYREASRSMLLIALVSFGLTLIPTGLLYGLSPWLAVVFTIPCLAFLLYRLKLEHFVQPSQS